MSKRRLFPILFICCIYGKIVWCNELASCYSQPTESCPLQNECKCIKTDESALFCCQVQSNEDLLKQFECSAGPRLSSIKALHIYNMTADSFNFARLSPKLSSLLSFSITNSRIHRLFGRLEHMHNIICLNLSNNAFGTEWQDPLALENLKDLAMLDLSNVNISRLPNIKIQVPLFWLDVSNNTKMHCDDVLDLLKSLKNVKYKLNFAKHNVTLCTSPLSYHWFNSSEILALSQIEIINKLQEDCPFNCSCRSFRFESQFTDLIHSVEVDCSNRYLSDLPKNLPKNTLLLNVTNNNISSIETLTDDQTYKTLRYFYADKNKISNILSLEGSHFMNNYAVLSLRLNQLKNLPIYILQNSFTKDIIGRHVYLGGNKLKCDCNTAQILKTWLLTNTVNIPDYDDILCENIHYKLKVIDLEQKIACITEADWTHYMYYVIAAELSVLLLLIGKVSYDYWVFKTAGYLPWPASKMPKLPCDWVFE